MHIIDITIVITYLALCIFIAFYKYKSVRTLKEYTIGRGYFPSIVIITSLFTTLGSANVIGSIGQVYALGMFFVVTRLLSPLFWIIMAKIYGQNIDQFRTCISLGDIMELLYGKIGRWVSNIVSILHSIGVVTIQAIAMGYTVSYFFNICYSHSVIIAVLIITIYSAFLGIKAVAYTDVFQFTVMMIAIPIAFSFAYHDIGGYEGVVKSLPEDIITLKLNQDNILLFCSMIFHALLPRTSGVYIQRFLISRDSIQLTHCLNALAVISFFYASIICLIGLVLKVKEPGIDPDIVFIHFIANHIPVGFKGLIIAGLLAIMMSTADAWLNNASVLVAHDVMRKIIPLTEMQALLIARIFTFLISISAIFLAMNKNGLVEMQLITANLWGTLLCLPLVAGFLKFRTNSKSFISANIIGICSAAISGYISGDLATISLMCGVIGSAVGLFGMHYWQVYQDHKIHKMDQRAQVYSIDF
ncbi:sodium:solute symporter family protein [Candidatus Lariskella endosymbiont of Hedychridium roseum]|uniref:sodium:solute symporter family protein n=1 Tax=Candidatus Lariskella endosymbiont of Hedychridium roseum TaxID=3077949 RepID=UPI0030D4DCBB